MMSLTRFLIKGHIKGNMSCEHTYLEGLKFVVILMTRSLRPKLNCLLRTFNHRQSIKEGIILYGTSMWK